MKCLIVGGNASIANDLNYVFASNDYEVYKTTRDKRFCETDKKFVYLNQSGVLEITRQVNLEKIDVLILCTGKLVGKDLLSYSDQEIESTFDANIILIIKFLRENLSLINDQASVVFISSIAASAGSFDEIYSASKAALYGLTKSLAKKSMRGIRFNCISPGLIEETKMMQGFSSVEIEKHKAETPLKKLVSKKDLAEICYDISQPHWSSLNGEILNVNGGRYV